MMLAMKNGAYVEHTGIDIKNYSLHYGTAIFEGLRSYELENNKYHIVELRAHIKRLFNSATLLNRPITRFSIDEIVNQVNDIVAKSQNKNLYIRPIITFGDSIMGIRNLDQEENIWILSWEWDIDRDSPRYSEGISVGISDIVKESQFSQAKVSANYLPSFSAINNKKYLKYDEVILLDNQGFVCETSAQNIFFVKNGEIYTPTLRSALAGITRNLIINSSKELNIKVNVCDIKTEDINTFSEAFISGTACEIVPIKSIVNSVFTSAKEDSITKTMSNYLLSYFYKNEFAVQ
jgi:branched-chain amino acid aminotransferase